MHLRRGNEERGWELHNVLELGINASLAENFTVERGTIFPLPIEYAQRVSVLYLNLFSSRDSSKTRADGTTNHSTDSNAFLINRL